MFELGLKEYVGVSLKGKWRIVLQAGRIVCTKVCDSNSIATSRRVRNSVPLE